MPVSFFVIVRGPLGVGKTTMARRLARDLRGEYVAIDEVLERHDLERWEDGYISERSFLRANEFAVEAAEVALRQGEPVVIDGNFYWRSALEDLERRLAYPHIVFTLKAPLAICIARDAARGAPLGDEGTRAVHAIVSRFDYGVPIDASGALEETYARLLGSLPESLTAAAQSR